MKEKQQEEKKRQAAAATAAKSKERESKALKAKTERADKLLTAAKKCDSMLTEVSADMIWRSVIRTGEVERRLQKAIQAKKEMTSFIDNEGYSYFGDESPERSREISHFLDKMQGIVELMTDLKDLCRDLRVVSPENLVKQMTEGGDLPTLLKSVFNALLNDRDQATLLDITCTFAKKLHGVTWTYIIAAVSRAIAHCHCTISCIVVL